MSVLTDATSFRLPKSVSFDLIMAALAILTALIIGTSVRLSEIDGELWINASTNINGSLNVTENLTVNGSICLDGSCVDGWGELNYSQWFYPNSTVDALIIGNASSQWTLSDNILHPTDVLDNVSIGWTTNEGYTLDVNGSMRIYAIDDTNYTGGMHSGGDILVYAQPTAPSTATYAGFESQVYYNSFYDLLGGEHMGHTIGLLGTVGNVQDVKTNMMIGTEGRINSFGGNITHAIGLAGSLSRNDGYIENMYAFYIPNYGDVLTGVNNSYSIYSSMGDNFLFHQGNTTFGGADIGTDNIDRQLKVIGDFEVGDDGSNYALIDDDGDLSFSGTADYLVGCDANDDYAFRYGAGENYGLMFSATMEQYQFLNGSGDPALAIGATSPKLEVWGDRFVVDGGGNALIFANLSVGAVDNLSLFVDSSSDRVGIGTSSPTHELNVVGESNFTGHIRLNTGDCTYFDGAGYPSRYFTGSTLKYPMGTYGFQIMTEGLFSVKERDSPYATAFSVDGDTGNTKIRGSLDLTNKTQFRFVLGANTKCEITCSPDACVFGQDLATNIILGCNVATTDTCICSN